MPASRAQTGRVRLALLPLVLLLPLTACGGDAPDTSAAPAGAIASSVPAAPSPTATGAPAAAAPADSSAPTAGVTASAGPGPTRSASAAAPAKAAGEPAAGSSAKSLATRAGRYTYDSKGTVTAGAAPRDVSGSAVLTVDPPASGRQSAVLDGDQGRTETDTLLKGDGRYVTRLLLTTPAFTKEFRPSPAALAMPEDAPVGRRWTFKATSTDGKTRASGSSRIVRTESVTVGGERVATRVVESTFSLRGDLVFDGTTTTNYAPEQRLNVKDRSKGKGTVSGVAFSTSTTSTLRSLTPR